MPRRRRISKERYGPPTLDELVLWTSGDEEDFVAEFDTLNEAREQWERRRAVIQTNGNPPEAFWIFDGPPTLRRVAKTALARAKTQDDAIALEDKLAEKRRRWLDVRGGDWTTITATSNGHA